MLNEELRMRFRVARKGDRESAIMKILPATKLPLPTPMPTSTREQILRTIEAIPETRLEEVLHLLQTIQSNPEIPESPLPTVLERMGGMPKFLIHNGQLSDRDQRRRILSDRIHQSQFLETCTGQLG